MSLQRKIDQAARTICSLAAFTLMTLGACVYLVGDVKLDRPTLISEGGSSALMVEEPIRFRVSEEYGWRLKASGIVSVLFGILMFAGCFLGEKKPTQQ